MKSMLIVTSPETGTAPLARMIFAAIRVDGSMGSLNVIERTELVATLVEPEAGIAAKMVGGVESVPLAVATTVLKPQLNFAESGFPATSFASVATVATYNEPKDSMGLGVNVAVFPSELTATLPGTGTDPLAKVMLVVFSVVGSMGSSKMTEMAELATTFTEPEAGNTETMVGGVESVELAMVNCHESLAAKEFPAVSRIPVVSSTV